MARPAAFVGAGQAAAVLERHYGPKEPLHPLTGERDLNFRTVREGRACVLKVFGAGVTLAEAGMHGAVLRHLEHAAPDLPVPRMEAALGGEDVVTFAAPDGASRHAILYSYIEGHPLMEVERNLGHALECGRLLARLGTALEAFTHPAMHRALIWDIRQLASLRDIIGNMREVPFGGFVTTVLDQFEQDAAFQLDQLPRQFVHNDLNARNIVVKSENKGKIAGIIDFGDAIHTARLCDVAVGVIGQLARPDSALAAMDAFVAGYEQHVPLLADEKALLPWLVAARIVQNVVLTAFYREQASESEHFSAFGADYFAWRVEFARQLLDQAGSRRSSK